MGSILTRLLLFLSSYFPLALILFVIFLQRYRWVAIGVLAVGTIGLIGMAVYLRQVKRFGAVQIRINGLQRRDSEAMSYIVSYVIPFLAVPFSGLEQGIALSIFFVVLGILYVNSNMIYINPMLNLAGYHIYEITLEDGSVHSLIVRRRISLGDRLEAIKIGEDIFMEKTA